MSRFCFLLSLVLSSWARCGVAAQASPPNVVLIITDDLGYSDLGAYGATDIRTPAIDGNGEAGVRLTDVYSNGVLCSPTRAGLISGRYQQRYALTVPLGGRQDSRGLIVTGNSLPQPLKDAGYATGLIGKWHLGSQPEFSPNAHGFDYFFGMLKRERVNRRRYLTVADARADVFDYIKGFHNPRIQRRLDSRTDEISALTHLSAKTG